MPVTDSEDHSTQYRLLRLSPFGLILCGHFEMPAAAAAAAACPLKPLLVTSSKPTSLINYSDFKMPSNERTCRTKWETFRFQNQLKKCLLLKKTRPQWLPCSCLSRISRENPWNELSFFVLMFLKGLGSIPDPLLAFQCHYVTLKPFLISL